MEALDADSTDIFSPSWIDDHYPHRPKELEDMCLYEFAKWYDIRKIELRNENAEYYKMVVILYDDNGMDILSIILDMMFVHNLKIISFHCYSCLNHGEN